MKQILLVTAIALSLSFCAHAMNDVEEKGFVIVQAESLPTRCKKMETELTARIEKINARLQGNLYALFDFDNNEPESNKTMYVRVAENQLTFSKQEYQLDLNKLKEIDEIYALEKNGTIKINRDGLQKLEQWYKDLFVHCEKPIDKEINALLLGDTPILHRKLAEFILKR